MEKTCAICGKDVSRVQRIKDALGRYYCAPCHAAALGTQPREQAVAAPVQAVAADAPGTDADPYDLAEPPPKKEEKKAACSACKRVLPEHLVQFRDGEFICTQCFSNRSAPGRPIKAKVTDKAKLSEVEALEDDGQSEFAKFLGTGPGIAVTACITGVAALLVMTAVVYHSQAFGKDLSAIEIAVAGVASLIYCVIMSGVLLVSMLIVDRIFGGLGFGTVSDVIWKSMTIVAASATIDYYSQTSETIRMLSFAFSPGAMLVGFVVLFKIDFFEAICLAVVNWLAGMVGGIVILAMLSHAAKAPPREHGPELHMPEGRAPIHWTIPEAHA